MLSIAFLTAPIDFLVYYTKHLAKAFQDLGACCQIIEIDDHNIREKLSDLFKSPPDCFFGIHAIQCDPIFAFGKPYLFEQLNKPYFCYQLDPTIEISHLIDKPLAHLLHVDANYSQLVSPLIPHSHFFPFGVDRELKGDEKKEGLVFFGSCFDYETLSQFFENKWGLSIVKRLKDSAYEALKDPCLNINQLVFNEFGDTPLFLQYMTFAESYMRAVERIDLIKNLCKNFAITVYGQTSSMGQVLPKKGWREYLTDCSQVIVKSAVSYHQSLQIMKKSRIVINSSPHFRHGFHDRFLNAIACNAVPLTNDIDYCRTHFKEGPIYYHYGEWEMLNENVNHVLKSKIDHLNNLNRQYLMATHTWHDRAKMFLKSIWTHT